MRSGHWHPKDGRQSPQCMKAVCVLLAAVAIGVAIPRQAESATSCTIRGTTGDDELQGTPEADVICGRGGDDHIVARHGADIVYGGRGDDVIFGKSGDDRIYGQQRQDYAHGSGGVDLHSGQRGRDCLVSRDGFSGDVLRGGDGRDQYAAGQHDIVRTAEVGTFSCSN
jgi:Ca2+-binding RTX toxin-like protein